MKLTEADVQRTVTAFLVADGWRPIRTEHALERTAGGRIRRKVGEVGMPDYLYVRYRPAYEHCPEHPCTNVQFLNKSLSELLWIEFKAPGQHPRPEQIAWHHAEQSRGALVLVVDDIDKFREWYKASGLQRR